MANSYMQLDMQTQQHHYDWSLHMHTYACESSAAYVVASQAANAFHNT